jgi:hypothetical protein
MDDAVEQALAPEFAARQQPGASNREGQGADDADDADEEAQLQRFDLERREPHDSLIRHSRESGNPRQAPCCLHGFPLSRE